MSDLFEKVEKAKKEWESSVDVISEGVAVYEAHSMTILRANWTLARFFDTSPHKLVDENLHQLLCGCMLPLCPIRSLLASPQADFLEYEPRKKEILWTLSTYPVPGAPEQSGRNVLVIRDITQERILQRQMFQAEAKASMIRTVANLAQQTGPTLSSLQQNLGTASRWVEQMRNALIDYRVALQTMSATQAPLSELTWEKIESRHHVEFLLQDFEELLDQSNHQMDRIMTDINNLSELGSESPNLQPSDLNMIVENSINAIWNDVRQKASIDRFYGRLSLVPCDPLRMQTGLVDLLMNVIKTFKSPKEIKVQTRMGDEQAEILVITSKLPKSKNGKDTSPLSQEGYESHIRPKLNTVYSVIEEHHGEIKIDYQNPEQFSIILSLPAKPPA
jgi:two-component system NtrC family sensor kinase